jgi:putative toxin-antitoxin system antitoxin component (TIGR02293 family)
MISNPGMAQLIGITPRSEFDLAQIEEKGLPTRILSKLREQGLTFTEVSEIVIPARTLKHRKARREPLSRQETERLVRVARIVALADSVFGSHEKALTWLRTADEELGGRTPMRILQTESGGRLVERLLWGIDEGVYS